MKKVVAETLPVDVLLLLDVSRSMEPHVERVVSAAHNALRALSDQDRIAIMVFDRGTRVRLPFRNSRQDVERELQEVIDRERFDGGTDITRGLIDAADYMARNARTEARRAIVVLTDDQTERDRNDASVLRALTRADAVLSALIAPDALHTGSTGRDGSTGSLLDDPRFEEFKRMLPPEFSADDETSYTLCRYRGNRARSGGDSVAVDDAYAFENTLTRLRHRYALYFYLPEDVKPGDERAIEVELSQAALDRYPGAHVQYRRSYLAPGGSSQPDELRPASIWTGVALTPLSGLTIRTESSMSSLFDNHASPVSSEQLEEGAVLLRGFASERATALVDEVARIEQAAPFRHLVTPGGYTMSVAMTNCGRVGWVSDRTGYRYDPTDPGTGAAWPAMPGAFLDLAVRAAAEAGFANYDPDACLINRYVAGAKLGLHQDRDEKYLGRPSSPCPLVYPRRSCGAGAGARTPCGACVWKAAMLWCGAVRRASFITESRRSKTGSTR